MSARVSSGSSTRRFDADSRRIASARRMRRFAWQRTVRACFRESTAWRSTAQLTISRTRQSCRAPDGEGVDHFRRQSAALRIDRCVPGASGGPAIAAARRAIPRARKPWRRPPFSRSSALIWRLTADGADVRVPASASCANSFRFASSTSPPRADDRCACFPNPRARIGTLHARRDLRGADACAAAAC